MAGLTGPLIVAEHMAQMDRLSDEYATVPFVELPGFEIVVDDAYQCLHPMGSPARDRFWCRRLVVRLGDHQTTAYGPRQDAYDEAVRRLLQPADPRVGLHNPGK